MHNLPTPQALLFDLDGVLADVSQSYRVAVLRTAEHFGAAVARSEVSAAKARGNANNDWDLTHRLLRERGIDPGLAEVTRVFEEYYQGVGDTPGLRATERLIGAGTRDVLARLAARMPLAIVTGRPGRDAAIFLRDESIDHHFAHAICLEDAPRPKPDPAPVLEAMRRLRVESAWMIGDTVDDVRAASAAGAVPLGIVPPAEDPDQSTANLLAAGARRVLRTVTELEALLEEASPGY